MSEEPTDQEAQDAAALARHLDGEDPAPEFPDDANTLVAMTSTLIDYVAANEAATADLYNSLSSLKKQHRKRTISTGEKPPSRSIEDRVAALEKFIEEMAAL